MDAPKTNSNGAITQSSVRSWWRSVLNNWGPLVGIVAFLVLLVSGLYYSLAIVVRLLSDAIPSYDNVLLLIVFCYLVVFVIVGLMCGALEKAKNPNPWIFFIVWFAALVTLIAGVILAILVKGLEGSRRLTPK